VGRKRSSNTQTSSIDAIFAQKMRDAKQKMGDNLYIDGEEASRIFCIDVPFAMKYLFQLSGYPLGRFVLVYGPP
jgi:hypothetical protein